MVIWSPFTSKNLSSSSDWMMNADPCPGQQLPPEGLSWIKIKAVEIKLPTPRKAPISIGSPNAVPGSAWVSWVMFGERTKLQTEFSSLSSSPPGREKTPCPPTSNSIQAPVPWHSAMVIMFGLSPAYATRLSEAPIFGYADICMLVLMDVDRPLFFACWSNTPLREQSPNGNPMVKGIWTPINGWITTIGPSSLTGNIGNRLTLINGIYIL